MKKTITKIINQILSDNSYSFNLYVSNITLMEISQDLEILRVKVKYKEEELDDTAEYFYILIRIRDRINNTLGTNFKVYRYRL